MSLSFFSLNIEAERHFLEISAYLLRHKPDVICLQEVFEVQAKELASELGYSLVFAPQLTFTRPETKFKPLGLWGVAILSRLPVIHSVQTYYGGSEAPVVLDALQGDEPHARVLLSVAVSQDEYTYTFATTHFTWAMPAEADRVQAADLARLLALLQKMSSFVLSGDFNAPRETEVFKQLSTQYRSWIPESVTSTLDPLLFRKRGLELVVDHLFSTPDYVLSDVEVLTGLSDHCALVARVEKR